MKVGQPWLARVACSQALLGLAMRPERTDTAYDDVERSMDEDAAGSIPEYVQGDVGAGKCPSLYRLVGLDYECEEAAEKLTLEWGGKSSIDNFPPGCEASEGRVVWNTAVGGPGTQDYRAKRRLICKRLADLETVYHLEELGKDTCTKGEVGGKHWDCEWTAKLAIDADKGFTRSKFAYRPGGWNHIPTGCSVHEDGTIQFNHYKNPKNKALVGKHHRRVCRELRAVCHDVPGWRDIENFDCAHHVKKGWCDLHGLGPNWKESWGLFEDWRNPGGFHAGKACCGCGRDPADEPFDKNFAPFFDIPGTQPFKDCKGNSVFNLTNPNWVATTFSIESPRFVEQCSAACLENAECNYLVMLPGKTCMGCRSQPDSATTGKYRKTTVLKVLQSVDEVFLAPRRGANGCPSGSEKPSSPAACEAAASGLGYKYKGEQTKPNYPKGCITNDKTRTFQAKAWWNNHPTGGGESNKFLLCQAAASSVEASSESEDGAPTEREDMFSGSLSTRPLLLVVSFVVGSFVLVSA